MRMHGAATGGLQAVGEMVKLLAVAHRLALSPLRECKPACGAITHRPRCGGAPACRRLLH
jgi:hypothetical protein